MEISINDEKKPSSLSQIYLDPKSFDSLSNSFTSTTNSRKPFLTGFSKVFHTRTRFLMMILCLLCLASVWSNILCFNFALICINHAEGIENISESEGLEQPINGSGGTPDDLLLLLGGGSEHENSG